MALLFFLFLNPQIRITPENWEECKSAMSDSRCWYLGLQKLKDKKLDPQQFEMRIWHGDDCYIFKKVASNWEATFYPEHCIDHKCGYQLEPDLSKVDGWNEIERFFAQLDLKNVPDYPSVPTKPIPSGDGDRIAKTDWQGILVELKDSEGYVSVWVPVEQNHVDYDLENEMVRSWFETGKTLYCGLRSFFKRKSP